MKSLITTLTILLTTNVLAEIKTRITDIEYGIGLKEHHLVTIAKDNTVLSIEKTSELVETAIEALEDNRIVEISVEEDVITDLEIIEDGDDILDLYKADSGSHAMMNYTPTDVESLDEAKKMFNYLLKRRSFIPRITQCFNRAHVWSRQMYNNDQINSMKIFIFYTNRYSREIDDKWWFHVAPMITVQGENYVMDKEFTNKPTTDDNWESIFTEKLRNNGIKNYRCKIIKNIGEYYDRENQNREYCNILVSSMHYWMPLDLSNLENRGIEQTQWSQKDLERALRNIYAHKWRRVRRSIEK